MVGMSEVLLNQRRSRSLVAETIVEVYHLDAMVFRDLVSKYESVRLRAWQMAGAFLTMQHPWGPYKGATFGELQSVFRWAKSRYSGRSRSLCYMMTVLAALITLHYIFLPFVSFFLQIFCHQVLGEFRLFFRWNARAASRVVLVGDEGRGCETSAWVSHVVSVFCRHSDLQVHFQGDQIKVEGTCYLASGDMAEMKMDGTRQHPMSAPAPLNAAPSFYVCLSDVKILKLPENGRAGHFAMKSTHSAGRSPTSAGGLRRTSLVNLSMRPSRVTTSSMTNANATVDRVSVNVAPRTNSGGGGANVSPVAGGGVGGGLGGIPEDAAYKHDHSRQNNDRDVINRQDPEPQWRLDQAVMSADMQFRQEAGRLRPQVTRASTGVTPPRSTYKEV